MTPISIVVLTYQRRDSILALLAQLTTVQDDTLDVIVVDNGSDDGTADAIAAKHPGVTLITLPTNR
ncbi:glycosyltransferase, partial [bacterium]|nr:glycosyltransferase [bacterium]